MIAGFLVSVLASPAWAEQETLIQSKSFQIRQETIKEGGILISRPKSADEKIKDIITLNQIRSFEDYARWLQAHMSYREDDRRDVWSDVQKTLKNKVGDCEDYTFLTSAVLKVLGYKPHFVALIRKGKAHAICTFKQDGYYYWFDNAKLQKTEATTLVDFAKHIIQEYNYFQLAELDPETEEWSNISVSYTHLRAHET